MRASQMFPSRFLKAVDLLNTETNEYREATVTIKHLKLEPVGQDDDESNVKPVLHLEETKKLMPLNKTNMMTLATNLGDETDGWEGKRITLYVTQEPFNGQVYDVVRVKPKPRGVSANTNTIKSTATKSGIGQSESLGSLGKTNGPAKPLVTSEAAKEDTGLDPDSIPF